MNRPTDAPIAPRIEPFALKDAPALIEAVFPAQKVSFEAQRERKAGAGQTLTALGSYWKGRKPLILVRAIVLGSLLPQTDDPEKDLEIFEKLMAFDEGGLARREPKISPAEIARADRAGTPLELLHGLVQGHAEDCRGDRRGAVSAGSRRLSRPEPPLAPRHRRGGQAGPAGQGPRDLSHLRGARRPLQAPGGDWTRPSSMPRSGPR